MRLLLSRAFSMKVCVRLKAPLHGDPPLRCNVDKTSISYEEENNNTIESKQYVMKLDVLRCD